MERSQHVTSVTDLFDTWATSGRAEGMERGHGARAVQALEDIGIRSGDKALDLGCGNGWATRWMRGKAGSFGFAAGVDASEEMITLAKSFSGRYGVQYRCLTFEDLPWSDGWFDHAFSMEALYYAPDLGAALDEVVRVLKVGGTFSVCTDFYAENPHCLSWPQDVGVPMNLLSEQQWQDALEAAGLELQRVWRCFDPRPTDDAEEAEFRTRIGTLALRGRKD